MGFMGADVESVRKTSWDAPLISEDGSNHARVFSKREDAVAYCNKMNAKLHDPNKKYIDIAPYSDYFVIPVQKGTAAEAKGTQTRRG